MCGFAGLISREPRAFDAGLAARVHRSLHHRGPDDHGFLFAGPAGVTVTREVRSAIEARVFVAHTRLAILDCAPSGSQPMSSSDNRYHIAFNGEIYNYLELRRELERAGYAFRSQSDTEVLLYALIEWGEAALARLVGMFAFAFLDARRHRILFARDPFGIKPLYYRVTDRELAFASEIPTLLEISGARVVVDPARMFDYVRVGSLDNTENTLIRDVRQLMPGHYASIDIERPQDMRIARYHDWTTAKVDIAPEEAVRELRRLFLESVSLHLRSDVKVGSALSGGLDSSSIVMAMRHVGGEHLPLECVSYVASDPRVSEECWVEIVRENSGAVIHKIHIQPGEIPLDIDNVIRAQGEPFASTSIYAQYRVFDAAKKAGIKVMLDGQGADELLGGYDLHLAAQMMNYTRKSVISGARFFARASQTTGRSRWAVQAGHFVPRSLQGALRRAAGQSATTPWLNRRWFEDRGVALESPPRRTGANLLDEQLHETLVNTSLPALLRYEDRNSMAHSVESRVPFLTLRVAEFIRSLPSSFIIDDYGRTKAVFRSAMRGIVPDHVLDRRDKIGFATPESSWVLELDDWVDRVITSEFSRSFPALRPDVLRAEWEQIKARKRPYHPRVWRWINLLRWAELTNATAE